MKRLETRIVHRDRYYFVIVRERFSFLGIDTRVGPWKEIGPRFMSKNLAACLAINVKAYIRGRYNPEDPISAVGGRRHR